MAITFVQRFAGSSTLIPTAGTITLPVSAGTSAGNTAILIARGESGQHVTGVTDAKGNAWTVDLATASGNTVSICSAPLTTGLATSDTITITFGATSTNAMPVAAYEYSGILTAGRVDKTASNSGTATLTGAAGPTATTTQAAELAITAMSANTAEATLSVSSPWTLRDSGQTTATYCVQMAEQVVASTQTFSATWTWGASANWAVAIITYKAAVAGPTWTPPHIDATVSL